MPPHRGLKEGTDFADTYYCDYARRTRRLVCNDVGLTHSGKAVPFRERGPRPEGRAPTPSQGLATVSAKGGDALGRGDQRRHSRVPTHKPSSR